MRRILQSKSDWGPALDQHRALDVRYSSTNSMAVTNDNKHNSSINDMTSYDNYRDAVYPNIAYDDNEERL